ncbi:MAG: hypothetical protein ACI93R_002771 [Flavobacteriales bacterium]|jgi:hypothetical protein
MQLDQFRAKAKPRSEWQALDLGVVMARTWYLKMLLVWLIPAMICYAIFATIFQNKPIYAVAITWWLKPFWDRGVLYIASRQLFGEHVDYRELIAQYLKLLKPDFLWFLTIRRFSPHRAYNLPITLLEKLKGPTRRKRLDLLHRRFTNGSLWLHITCAHIEGFISLGIFAAIALLIPQGVQINWQEWVFEEAKTIELLSNALSILAMALVAPFYVCSGFALYLQRRIDLEGWDIEIRFRQLAQRRRQVLAKLRSSGFIALLCLGFACLSASPKINADDQNYSATGQSESTAGDKAPSISTKIEQISPEQLSLEQLSPEQRQAKHDILELFKSVDFRELDQRRGFRFKKVEPEESLTPNWLIQFADWLDKHGGIFSSTADALSSAATIIEILIWAAVLALIIFLALHFKGPLIRLIRAPKIKQSDKPEAPKVLFGLDVTEDSLPDDIIAEAQAAWAKQQQRVALSLILRASIVKLIQKHNCKFLEGNTERECAEIVSEQLGSQIATFFWTLTRQWQALAYAHTRCEESDFLHLCAAWQEAFENV